MVCVSSLLAGGREQAAQPLCCPCSWSYAQVPPVCLHTPCCLPTPRLELLLALKLVYTRHILLVLGIKIQKLVTIPVPSQMSLLPCLQLPHVCSTELVWPAQLWLCSSAGRPIVFKVPMTSVAGQLPHPQPPSYDFGPSETVAPLNSVLAAW